jgi:hypothetical protein
MKPLKVRVAYGKTINIGNYESIKLHYEVEVEFDRDEDTVPLAIDTTREYLKEKMATDIAENKHK